MTADVAEVAVLAPIPGPYTYQVPPFLRGELQVGARVWVPLRGRNLEGVVLRLPGLPAQGEARMQLRSILQRIDSPALPKDLLSLGQFIAEYYLVPHGEALRLVLPPGTEARAAQRVALSQRGLDLSATLGSALWPPEAAALSPREQQVLVYLRRLGGQERQVVSCARLLKEFHPTQDGLAGEGGAVLSLPDLLRVLHRLAEAGFIDRTEHLQAGVKPVIETLVTAAPGPADDVQAGATPLAKRAPRRAALLSRLQQDGPQFLSALSQDHPRAAAQVKALLAAGLVTVRQRERVRDPMAGKWGDAANAASRPGLAMPQKLTPEQQHALVQMVAALDRLGDGSANTGPGSFLLHGVTGSGKTEVYLQLIAEVLRRERTALMLVPEIGLTPQLLSRFRARFGPDVAVLHSGLTAGERADSWRQLIRGEVRIALGPRSALFAPLARLGVVIVDEEHDASFKQQDGVRYHGRDVALVRAQRAGALTVLGSATPSLESLAMVESGKLVLLHLPYRATGRPMPQVQIIDLKQHLLPDDGLISAPLHQALAETLSSGEQAILFLNRRGYATFLLCRGCGHRFECKHCAVTLTWHKGEDHLLCHYCGYVERLPTACPLCQAQKIDRLGMGTEKIEEQIAARYPGARVSRLDRDTATGAGLGKVLAAMHRREIDILIGTQMLAKGHDFPGVTLVGVVLADTGIGLPDFRASERTFQILAQVAGRAGRADRPGRVLVQTFNPQHPAIVCACEHDYARFTAMELQARRELFYPPFSRLAALRLDGIDPVSVRSAAEAVAKTAREVSARAPQEAQVSLLGPAEAPLSRLKGRTRWQLFVRAANVRALRTIVRAALRTKLSGAVRLSVDVDPVTTL